MKTSGLDAAYETARRWSVSPVSHPPPGWVQIVRGGVAAWVHAAPPLCPVLELSLQASPVTVSPLLTVVAAMIAEVF